MASDDSETKATDPPLATTARGAGPSGRWLALVPMSVAFVLLFLMMPRAVAPDDVPAPAIDARAIRAVEASDDQLAAAARRSRLPDDVLVLGTALRAFGKAQAESSLEAVADARAHVDVASRDLLARGGDRAAIYADLRALRAVQLDAFLAEVVRFEQTGETSKELDELAGGFVTRMRDAGWIEGQRVLLTERERRVTFKLVWTTILGASLVPELALTLDEQRALYALYLRAPHAPDAQRATFQLRRRAASSDDECARVAADERAAAELWRAEKIRKLGQIDAAYPTSYALGVAYFRARRFGESVDAFRTWIERHPDGPWTLRAKNHMKAALDAYGP